MCFRSYGVVIACIVAFLWVLACDPGTTPPGEETPVEGSGSKELLQEPLGQERVDAGPEAIPEAPQEAPRELTPEERCAVLPNACTTQGEARCTPQGAQSCVSIQGCLQWTDPTACAQGERCVEGRCQACATSTGSMSNQPLAWQGGTRYFWIHVPKSYKCDTPTALLMDFHGTASSSVAQPNATPEETYLLPTLQAIAEKEGWIIVRPRSLSRAQSGTEIFQWDINPGDLEKNVQFALALVKHLQTQYTLDPKRLYASGFSSGSNMVTQFLGVSGQPFRGIAPIAGGIWNLPTALSLGADAPRIYALTGYRDYLHGTLRQLVALLQANQYPMEKLYQRRVDASHELSPWHMQEVVAWLERGETLYQDQKVLAQGWTRLPSPAPADDLLELAFTGKGDVVAAGTKGRIWHYQADKQMWQMSAEIKGDLPSPTQQHPSWTGLCILPSGAGWVVGEGWWAATEDSGQSWKVQPRLSTSLGGQLGYVYLLGLDCKAGGALLAGGYWNSVHRTDNNASWKKTSATLFQYDAQVTSLKMGANGTNVAVGNYFIGRGASLEQIQSVQHPGRGWMYDVATAGNGLWWVVGAEGQILHSSDDGKTWRLQHDPGTGEKSHELFAISFYDEKTGAAVGAFGSAWLTTDGGQNWTSIATGLPQFLGDVAFKDAKHLWVVGEGGTMLTYTIP